MKGKVTKEPDRRVRKTRQHLRDALVTLTLERGWDAVSVRDVCEKADVGRSTFYVHFADKENLLLSGFDELHSALDSVRQQARTPFDFIEPLIVHAHEHRPLLQALIGRQSGQQMQWRFRDVVTSLVTAELDSMKVPRAVCTSTAQFIAGGMCERLMHWLEQPRGVTAGRFATELTRLALGVIDDAKRR